MFTLCSMDTWVCSMWCTGPTPFLKALMLTGQFAGNPNRGQSRCGLVNLQTRKDNTIFAH